MLRYVRTYVHTYMHINIHTNTRAYIQIIICITAWLIYLSRAITWHDSKQLVMKQSIPLVNVNTTLPVLRVILAVCPEHLKNRAKYLTIDKRYQWLHSKVKSSFTHKCQSQPSILQKSRSYRHKFLKLILVTEIALLGQCLRYTTHPL